MRELHRYFRSRFPEDLARIRLVPRPAPREASGEALVFGELRWRDVEEDLARIRPEDRVYFVWCLFGITVSDQCMFARFRGSYPGWRTRTNFPKLGTRPFTFFGDPPDILWQPEHRGLIDVDQAIGLAGEVADHFAREFDEFMAADPRVDAECLFEEIRADRTFGEFDQSRIHRAWKEEVERYLSQGPRIRPAGPGPTSVRHLTGWPWVPQPTEGEAGVVPEYFRKHFPRHLHGLTFQTPSETVRIEMMKDPSAVFFGGRDWERIGDDLAEVPRESRLLFVLSLFHLVLVDQAVHAHFPYFRRQWQRRLRIPKFGWAGLGFHNEDPVKLLDAAAESDLVETGSAAELLPAFFDVVYRDFSPLLDAETGLSMCALLRAVVRDPDLDFDGSPLARAWRQAAADWMARNCSPDAPNSADSEEP